MNDIAKILTGDSILIHRIASLLEENGIPTLIKDVPESARLAGFGVPGNSIELYVNTADQVRAKKIIRDLNSESNR